MTSHCTKKKEKIYSGYPPIKKAEYIHIMREILFLTEYPVYMITCVNETSPNISQKIIIFFNNFLMKYRILYDT